MIVLTLHDEDAKALLDAAQRDDIGPLAPDQLKRIAEQLKCALALCDCGRGARDAAQGAGRKGA